MNARELSNHLSELLRREHVAMAEFLVALAGFDARRVWETLGHPSLFMFLHRELGLSKGAAYYRKTAAELVQRFPELVEPLADGRLCITSIAELAKVVTTENRGEVIPRFFNRSKQEAREVVSELKPVVHAPRRDVVTAAVVPAPPPARSARSVGSPRAAGDLADVPALNFASTVSGFPDELVDANRPARSVNAPTSRAERDTVDPLTAELRRLHVTVSAGFLAKLETARDALSHSHPGASTEAILAAGLDLLLGQDAKRKGLVEKPRRERRAAKPEHVAAEVKRAIRDGGCCQWPVEGGGVCGSTHRLQLDHVQPKALGGPSTVENVRLLCASHNLLAARRVFGDRFMDRFTAPRPGMPPPASQDACPP